MTVGDFDGKVLRHLIGYFLYHCMPLVLIVRIFMSAMGHSKHNRRESRFLRLISVHMKGGSGLLLLFAALQLNPP